MVGFLRCSGRLSEAVPHFWPQQTNRTDPNQGSTSGTNSITLEKRMVRLYDFHTDMGQAWIAWQDPGDTVVEIGLPGTFSPEVIDRYRRRHGESIQFVRSTSDEDIVHAVQSYFSGRKVVSFPFWHRLGFGSMTESRIRVLHAVYAIPYGRTRSYSSIAAEVGKPAAGRFVGNTMAANPFPVIIPCHRVIRKDGSLGGFGGGIALKRRMLEMEQQVVAS